VVVGHAWGPLGWGLRGICLVSASMLVMRAPAFQLAGLALYAAVLGWGAWSRRGERAEVTTA
jgi:hypothetical protein